MRWRLLLSPDARPAWNMALDEALLCLVEAPTLRLYAFDPPGLTIGRFQEAPGAPAAPAVRRPTGGGAILHRGEMTFTIVLPAGHSLHTPDVRASYAALLGPFKWGIEAFGVRTARPPAAAGGEHFLCFRRASPVDLAWRGRKLLGSAQRRTRAGVLMHGVIYLEDPGLPEAVSLSEAAGRPLTRAELAEAVCAGFRAVLGAEPHREPPSPGEAALASRLERDRYSTTEWNQTCPAGRRRRAATGAAARSA